ncbi:MAG TPA: Fe-S-containing protein, partial [Verrucomicrobiae bacterium]|nr:Fe-S-containing protein [Verrucomicrobiae bacterium]
LVCDTCSTRWALGDLTGLGGGCVKYPPAQLKYTVDKTAGKILISETDLKNWHPREYDASTTMGR